LHQVLDGQQRHWQVRVECILCCPGERIPCSLANSILKLDKLRHERAWSAISRFYDNCKKGKLGKKGFPRFKKHQTHGSVEYKTTGYKLSEDRKSITFTDGFAAGIFKLWGTRDLHFYQLKQIKRVRVVRRAHGYYVQFCIDQERIEKREPTNRTIGLDVGLTHFYTDSNSQTVDNPRQSILDLRFEILD
jgi:putative transposase